MRAQLLATLLTWKSGNFDEGGKERHLGGHTGDVPQKQGTWPTGLTVNRVFAERC